MITVIGIGNEKGDLTRKAERAIEKSKRVFLRSAKTEAGKAVVGQFPDVIPLDDVFINAEDFDALIKAVCDKITAADSESGSAAYLTDGEGMDAVAARLVETAGADIIYGVAPSRTRGAWESGMRLTATDALMIKPYLDTSLPLRVTEIDDRYLAGDLKLWLMNYYADDAEISVYAGGKLIKTRLCELDRLVGYGYSCEMSVTPEKGYVKKKYSFGDLLRIMGRLTAFDGCPWDKAQTHESIRINMIEEAYEAVDAINCGDADAMTEELGDVMLQSVFHCDMGERTGEFTLADVIDALCRKLVGRHTHIFGENRASDAGEALGFWEAAKSEEKSYVSTADKLDRLPECFPALLAAEKVYKKLLKVCDRPGDEWFERARSGGVDEKDIGKKLFAAAADAADKGVDAEVALSSFIANIKRNFAKAEASGDVKGFLKDL